MINFAVHSPVTPSVLYDFNELLLFPRFCAHIFIFHRPNPPQLCLSLLLPLKTWNNGRRGEGCGLSGDKSLFLSLSLFERGYKMKNCHFSSVRPWECVIQSLFHANDAESSELSVPNSVMDLKMIHFGFPSSHPFQWSGTRSHKLMRPWWKIGSVQALCHGGPKSIY